MRKSSSALHVILFISLLHLGWAALLAGSAAAAHSTPVSAVITVAGSRTGAIAMLAAVAALALTVSWFHRRPRHSVRPSMLAAGLIPQQFVLFASAFGGIHAAAAGHYADGVIRDWTFILGDQLPIIIAAFLYTTAILAVGSSWPD